VRLALVGRGLESTLATRSQSEVALPGIVCRSIREKNAWVEVDVVI
jgi:hypothetical protein